MLTSFGVLTLKFVRLSTLFQFVVPRAPSTRWGKTIVWVDEDAGSAFKTAIEGLAIKSRATTTAAIVLVAHAHLKRMCVAWLRSALRKMSATSALKNPFDRIRCGNRSSMFNPSPLSKSMMTVTSKLPVLATRISEIGVIIGTTIYGAEAA